MSDAPASRSISRWLRRGITDELELFRGRPLLVLSVLAVIFVPALYAGIYLASVWDPYGNMERLPVALVNNDTGTRFQDRAVDLGAKVVDRLRAEHPFRFTDYASVQAAKDAIGEGREYFAVVFPQQFSARAVTGSSSTPGELTVYVSEGTSFMASIIGRRFADQLATLVNRELDEQRWTAVLAQLDPDSGGLAALADGIAKLSDGAQRLDAGVDKLNDGAQRLEDGFRRASAGAQELADGSSVVADGTDKLVDGMRRVGAGVRLMGDKLPSRAALETMAAGSRTVSDRSAELMAGLDRLLEGIRRVREGEGRLRQGAARAPIGGRKLAEGAGRLEAGLTEIETGMEQAVSGGGALHAGLVKLDGGVRSLTTGIEQLEAGIREMDAHLPDGSTLDELARGAEQVRDGNAQLATVLGELQQGTSRLAAGISSLSDGSSRMAEGLGVIQSRLRTATALSGSDARGLAASIRSVDQSLAPVVNNGTAFAPYFTALALWVGTVVITFLFHFRWLTEAMRAAPRVAKFAIKAAVPVAIVLAQATIITLSLHFIMGIKFASPVVVWAITLAGSLTFVAVVLALTTVLGDAGRLVAVLLLIVQLAAAGGIFPIELSSGFYQAIHSFMPITDLVKALRAAMFGAYNGQWVMFVLRMLGVAGLFVMIAVLFARWKHVPTDRFVPAVEL